MMLRFSRLLLGAAALAALSGCVAMGEGGASDADRAWGLGGVKLAPPPEPPPAEVKPSAPEPARTASGAIVVAPLPGAPPQPVGGPGGGMSIATAAPPPPPEDALAEARRAAQTGDSITAAALFQQRLEQNPDDVDARVGLAGAYLAENAIEQAEAAIAPLRERSAADPRVLVMAARLDLARGDLSGASVRVIAATARAPGSRDVLMVRGMLEDLRGDHMAAQAAYRLALAAAPGDPAVINNLALSLVATGDAAQAADLLTRLAGDRPERAPPKLRHNLALALGALGKEDAARPLLSDLKPEELEENLRYYRSLRKN
jgi:Flp pilus assembly protein TadD